MQIMQSTSWTPALTERWARIAQHDFELGQPLGFIKRLARDKSWTLPFAQAAVREYRRFCFLAITSPNPVTPSEEIDEVWHMHLTYSRDYWNVWCRDVLQVPLHHDPTRGSLADQGMFRAQYAATLALYETYFGPPDALFWRATHERFRGTPRCRTIDVERWLLVPKPSRFFRWRPRFLTNSKKE